jgi:hypothetical protein
MTQVKAVWGEFENKYSLTQDLSARSQLRGEAMAQEYKLEQDLKRQVFLRFEVSDINKADMAWQLATDYSDSIEERIEFFAKLAILIK